MSNIVKVILVLACVSAVLAVQSNTGNMSLEQQQSIEKEIMKVHAGMVKAAENYDAEGLFSYVLDECKGVIVQDGNITMTRQEALNAAKEGMKGLKDISYKFNKENITIISPTVALWVANGTTSITITEDGRQLNIPFAETIVFVQRDGQWKVFHAHRSNPNTP